MDRRREGGVKPPMAAAGGPAGFDCSSAATALGRCWKADIAGTGNTPLMQAAQQHFRACPGCATRMRRLIKVAGAGDLTEATSPSASVPRVNATCLAVALAAQSWFEAEVMGAPSKDRELIINNHPCGCYACLRWLRNFGADFFDLPPGV